MILYYYPCKPKRIYPDSPIMASLDNHKNWIAEVKRRGWRCLVYKEKGTVTLWTRHKTLIQDALIPIRTYLQTLPDGIVLDGELIERATKNIKGILYLFDMIVENEMPIFNLSLHERRKRLENTVKDYPDCIQIPEWVRIGKKRLYEMSIDTEDQEGIVMKKIDSPYLISFNGSKDTPFWLKVKKPENHIYTGGAA